MTIPVLIFSRMDSRRLPDKALKPVAGRALLARVIDRVKQTQSAMPVIVCTSDRDADDPIEGVAEAEGVMTARGSADDVLGRALDCAGEHGFEDFVRISGDSPFIDPGLIDRMTAIHKAEGADLTTNVFPRSFPPGASVEVINTDALKRAANLTTDPQDREHVTRYFYAHPADFTIRNEPAPADAPAGLYEGISLTVDTPEDLAQAQWIAERLAPDAGFDEAVALAREFLKMGRDEGEDDR